MITTPLHLIRFVPGFASWQRAAQYLLEQGIMPSSVEWIETDEGGTLTPLPVQSPLRCQEQFLKLARLASFHRSPERWSLLYRVLWRLVHGQSRLLNELLDPDVNRLHNFAREVEKEVRHLVATAHFAPVDTEGGTVQVAWFIPRHHCVELAAPQLARQWGNTLWSLLTPERCVHWNGRQLVYSRGELQVSAGSPRQLERIWRERCASYFDLKPQSRNERTLPIASREEWDDLPLFRKAA